MFKLVAGKMASGDIYVTRGRLHLERNEWGLAYHSLESAFAKGNLSDNDLVRSLFEDVCERLGVASKSPNAPGTEIGTK